MLKRNIVSSITQGNIYLAIVLLALLQQECCHCLGSTTLLFSQTTFVL